MKESEGLFISRLNAALEMDERQSFAKAANGRLADEMDIYFCGEIRRRDNLPGARIPGGSD